MKVTRYEPLSLVSLLHGDLNTLAERGFDQPKGSDNDGCTWIPAVDIAEEKARFVLHADLPGVSVDDIDVQMEDGVLSIAGERRRQVSENVDGVQRYERSIGKFFRRFSLPEMADAENIKARCINGILEITIPKQPEVQARRITVEAA